MAEAGLLSTAPAYAVLVRFVSHPHGRLCPHGQSRTVVLNWRLPVQLVGGASPLLNHDICADAFSLLRATASTLYLSLFNFARDCLFWSRQCRYPIQFHQNLPVSSLPLPLNRSPLGFSGRTPSQAAGTSKVRDVGVQTGSGCLLLPLGRGGIQTPPASWQERDGCISRRLQLLAVRGSQWEPCHEPGPWRSELHAFLDLNHEVQRDADRGPPPVEKAG
jgi:hypothetical protein